MYNGNGNGRYTNIGGFRVKPMYLYIAAIIAVLIAVFVVLRFLNTSLVVHFGAFAGLLLLVANVRELIGQSYSQRGSTALLNVLVAGGLIFAWLSQFFGALLWIPAIALVGGATPLILGRASVYAGYISAAKVAASTAADGVRRTIIR